METFDPALAPTLVALAGMTGIAAVCRAARGRDRDMRRARQGVAVTARNRTRRRGAP